VSGKDGLDAIRHIVQHASSHLKPSGWLIFEHGYNQASEAQTLLQEYHFCKQFIKDDTFGQNRVSGGQLKAGSPIIG